MSARTNNYGSIDFLASLKDALTASIITFLLCIGIVSHTIEASINGLSLASRWDYVLIAVVLVFTGRFLWSLRQQFTRPPEENTSSSASPASIQTSPYLDLIKTAAIPGLIVFAFIFPVLPVADRQFLTLAIEIMTYIMLGWGLNIVVGLAGMLDLGYVAFYAVGAYSFALLAEHFGLSFWMCLPLAGILAAFWGILLGFPVLRLRGDYLAIVTLAFGEIIRVILVNWHEVTGGPDGLFGIPKPTFPMITFSDTSSFLGIPLPEIIGLTFSRFGDNTFSSFFGIEYASTQKFVFLFYIILILALLTNYITLRLKRLPLGRAWEALREDEIACRSLGINTTTTKLAAFSIGAMFGGFAGAFFATKQGSITPNSFVFMESAIILAIVVLGGMRSQIGVVIAAVALVGMSEFLRNVDFIKDILGQDFNPAVYRMLIFGSAMVIVMVLKPKGLIASRAPSIVLKKQKAISGDLIQEGKG